jgi:hypothetical protein
MEKWLLESEVLLQPCRLLLERLVDFRRLQLLLLVLFEDMQVPMEDKNLENTLMLNMDEIQLRGYVPLEDSLEVC